MPSWL